MDIATLLGLKKEEHQNYKVNFSTSDKNAFEPLYAFYNNEYKEWQEKQTNSIYDRKFIVSFIYFDEHEWLFAGIYEVKEIYKTETQTYYETELLDQALDLIGKLVIRYDKIQRKRQVNFESVVANLQLSEILKEKRTIAPFSSFDSVKVNYKLLCSIVSNESYSWKYALSNAKGIYLITDLKSGRMYVGAAYGDLTFWDRWKDYQRTGHGGNKFLKKLIMLHGIDYLSNLQFSFLDVKDKFIENKVILERESYWKDVLVTREFGFNLS